MMFTFFIVLVAFGVLSDATEENVCEQERPRHCLSPELEKIRFPDSQEALNNICPILLPTVKCLLDFKTKCGVNIPGPFNEKLENFHDVMIHACDKKSNLHQDLSTYLPCIDEVHAIERNVCRPMVKKQLQEISSELSLERNEEGYFENREDSNKFRCLSAALDLSCFVAITSVKCGEGAKDMIGALLERLGFMDEACPGEIGEEVKEAVSHVLLQMEVKLATEEILTKM